MSSFAQKGGPETSNPAHWAAVFGAGVSVAMLGYMYACRYYQSDKTVAQVFREAKMKMARGLIHDAVGMFEEADLDHNGELSRTELESFLLSHPNMVHTLARHGIESVSAFDQMDVNADGSISKQEFLSAVLPVVVFETTVHDIFAQYDKDQLSKVEFKDALHSMGTMTEISSIAGDDVKSSLFTQLDADGDGLLTRDEFVSMFANVIRQQGDAQ